MDRLACVDLPVLPLQLLLRRHPEWQGEAVAVVAEDHPQGRILWVNEAARRQGVLAGHRYGPALAAAPGLRAGVVAAGEVAGAGAAILHTLRRFTPRVEPSPEEPGLFWLEAAGLHRLHPSLHRWGRALRAALKGEGLEATVVVGFSRFGSHAVARAATGVRLLTTPAEERQAAGRVSLARLGLAPEVRDRLARLGVTTVAQLLALPAAGLLDRYGPDLHRLHRLATGDLSPPLAAAPEALPVAAERLLDFPEGRVAALVRHVQDLLGPLLQRLAGRQAAVAALRLQLRLDCGAVLGHSLRPAAATNELSLLLELVRLRLEGARVGAGVVEIGVEVEAEAAGGRQLCLLATPSHRDRQQAEAALARVRAELGEGAVGRLRLRDAHLPEARFAFEPLEGLPLPCPPGGPGGRLVRRFVARPLPLAAPAGPGGRGRDGAAPVTRRAGSYLLSGGWWQGEVAREYAYGEGEDGALLWLFHDRRRRRWFLQGRVV